MTELSKSELLAKTVIRGTNDFLFFTDHEAIEQVSGAAPLDAEELDVWTRTLTTRYEWCRQRGIEVRFLFVPEKHVVYSDYLPVIEISEQRPVVQILNSLPEQLREACMYPVDQLKAARQTRELYYKTDTHWNNWGGFFAYDLLMDSLPTHLDLKKVTESDLKVTQRKIIGDLGVRLEPEEEERSDVLGHATELAFKRIYDNSVFSRGNTSVFISPRVSAPRVVVFRDSFFNYILPHMIPVFSRTVAVSSLDMHHDLVESEKPDLVIFEMIERFVGNKESSGKRVLPTDGEGTFADLAGVALDELRPGVNWLNCEEMAAGE
jgi:alginate O-acetyltransferase complex protein AlgJ